MEDDSTQSIPLGRPLQTKDGRTLNTLRFRRPKARDLRRMDAAEGEMSKSLALVPVLCLDEIAPVDVDELDGADAVAIGKALGKFLSLT